MAVTVESRGLRYLPGFGNHFASEAVPGSLPVGQNTPTECPMGLYAEQLSGTAFTAPRSANQRSWLYRIRPSVCHLPATKYAPHHRSRLTSRFSDPASAVVLPNQLRWDPLPLPGPSTAGAGAAGPADHAIDFVDSLFTYCGSGDPMMKSGVAVHLYACNADMKNKSFYNADGDLLIVPQKGELFIRTEMGRMAVAPGEICVVPRGIVFSVNLTSFCSCTPGECDKPDSQCKCKASAGTAEKDQSGPVARGYVCEVYNGHFKLPDLGPIGANGLANPRDFLAPVARFEDILSSDAHPFVKVSKFLGELFETKLAGCPFDVVAWHGNYYPFKYDLSLFCAVNSVTFDHLDPSIFTVLTCQTTEPGVAAVDFVIFPPRWIVAENTFRPPYFHRNCMSEFMGLIRGVYDAKEEGFVPGGASLHSCMTPHGPDTATYAKASKEKQPQTPVKYPNTTLAFMFESTYIFKVTPDALNASLVQAEYYKCWQGLNSHFTPPAASKPSSS